LFDVSGIPVKGSKRNIKMRLAKLKTERDQSNSDAARLKVEKDELLNMLQKQKSSNDAGRHCKDALNNQLHEKDMECKQSKKIVENLNRKLDEIQSQQREFLKHCLLRKVSFLHVMNRAYNSNLYIKGNCS
jgi:chromosome segregation ATPase